MEGLRLDLGTLAFAAAVTALASGMVVAAYGTGRHPDGRWRAFSLSALSYGAGLMLMTQLASPPPASLVQIGTMLLATAAMALHAGCCLVAGRRLEWALYGAFLLIYGAVTAWFLWGEDSLSARMAAGSVLRACLFTHAAWILWQRREAEPGAGIRLLAVVIGGWAVLLLFRVLLLLQAGPITTPAASLRGFLALYYLLAALAYVMVVMGVILVDSGRMMRLIRDLAPQPAISLEAALGQHLAEGERLRRVADSLGAILDEMPDIFYRTDRRGYLLMVSRSAEKLLGYAPTELIGSDAARIHASPESRQALIATLEAAGGSVIDYELQLRHKDGRLVWAATSSRFYLDERGERAGTEGIVRLIEERKRTELYIRESQSLVQAMLDASTDAIMLFKPDGILLAVNHVMARRFGRQAAELTGSSLWDLFPPEVAEGRKAAMAAILESGQAAHYLDQRGDLHLDNSVYPVRGAEGQFDKLAVYSRDITAQCQAEARIQSYLADLERSNAELEQFAYVASHDLREPLRMIASYLSLLERRYGAVLDGDGMEFLGFARDGAKRMDRLVLDLLDFSRIERRGAPLVEMRAGAALDQALRHLSPAIAEAGARIHRPADDPAGPLVMGDPEQIIRLFQNLIGNAVKYRAEGRQTEITIGWSAGETEWEFAVGDNGIGIAPEYFERIFRIFQRLHTSGSYEGTGIGLAICKKIVERHGGRIWVESLPGEGTSFRFTLPKPQPT